MDAGTDIHADTYANGLPHHNAVAHRHADSLSDQYFYAAPSLHPAANEAYSDSGVDADTNEAYCNT